MTMTMMLATSWTRRLVRGSYRRCRRFQSSVTTTSRGISLPIRAVRTMRVAFSPLLVVSFLHWSNNSATATAQRNNTIRTTTRNEGSQNDNHHDDSSESTSRPIPLDATKQWKTAKDFLENNVWIAGGGAGSSTTDGIDDADGLPSKLDRWLGLLSHGLGSAENDDQTNHWKEKTSATQETKRNLDDIYSTLMGIMAGRSSNQVTVDELIAKVRSSSEQGDVSDSLSLEDLLTIMRSVNEEFEQLIKKHLVGKHLPTILPTNLYYFLENEDQVKNFSWRRRKHRFCRGINIEYVNELNSYMRIAEIGYMDDLETIQRELSETFGYEVIYCQMDSLPGQPSHFLAVKKEQSKWSSSLDMMLCVRGTATITDVVTDLLADAVDYQGGKAHSGISKSGKYLADKHMGTFRELLKASDKKKINLTLVGHSLGAGAAAIAGIELQARDDVDVQVIGFGCPAVVSKELSESTRDYITTVVADNDCIPRMSVAGMFNTLMDIGEYNWVPRAKEDLEDCINQVQSAFPALISDSVKESLLEILSTTVLSSVVIPPSTEQRMEPVLFPPGKCIHFYRDGYGTSGAVVPCTFFDSIDVHRRMVEDHLIDTGYRSIFFDLMRQYTKDHHFQFDVKK